MADLRTGGSFMNRLKSFDAYPKTLEDFRVKTTSGSIVSIVAGVIMVSLVISEFSYFLETSESHELFVDRSLGKKFKIHLDVTFPRMPCNMVTLDAMDVSGEHQLDVVHNVYKKRLDQKGRVVEAAKKEAQLARDKVPVTPANVTADYCGDCYGAEEREGECCNTCETVREKYRKKGWAFGNPESIEQCVREGWTDQMDSMKGEGCNIFGYLEVKRVAGNFHFAPGTSFSQSHMHVHDLMPFKGKTLDFSHKINKLSFGEKIPTSISDPLTGYTREQSAEGNHMFQYYVKVVPTAYEYLVGRTVNTNQYSVTEHQRIVGQGRGHGLPGVFFMYDFSPIMIKISEGRKSFGHFLTGVCAIVGGIFTVAGMVDSFIFHSLKSLEKKIELGKQT